MRFSAARSVSLLALSSALACAPADDGDPARILDRVASAMGGKDRILAVRTLMVRGEGDNYNLGQNLTPDAELPRFQVTEFQRTIDFEHGRWRQEQSRVPTFFAANTNPVRQITAIDGDIAFNVVPSGDVIRASETVARDRRRELSHHPIGILRAAWQPGALLRFEQQDSLHNIVAIDADEESHSLVIDRSTNLPVAVRTLTTHTNLGDVVVETSFADYRESGGLQLPMHITTKLDRFTLADIRLSSAVIDTVVADLEATADLRGPGTPVQQINIAVEELAPGVWYLAGQSHHSALIEFADHLMLVEAPLGEERTLAVIARARELKPEKPLRYVVNTHHHFDHSAGLRAAIAEGLTVVTHASNEAFVREMAERPFTVAPDALARAPRPLQIETVSDRRVFEDATRRVEVFPLEGSQHAETLLAVYVPANRLLIEVDVYSPPAPDAVNPPPAVFAPNLVENIRRLSLRVDRVVPLHGRVATFAELEAAAQAAATRTP
jgi:glyoxylase-like metal-dependent hydrolase (beta-lactamase superfamily II)